MALAKSIELNGTSQSVSAADSTSLSLTGGQTHEGWVYFDSFPSSGNGVVIFDKYAATGNQRGISVVYENSGGTLRWNVRTSNNGSTVASGTLNYTLTIGWHFLRFVYSTAGTVAIYVDDTTTAVGTVSSLATSIFDNTASYRIGYNADISGYLDGRVSLWRVWNGSHTTADTTTVYGTATTDLRAEWSLDNVLTDASGNSNTLTNNGSAVFMISVPVGLRTANTIGIGGTATSTGTGTTGTYAHTVDTGSDRILIVAVDIIATADRVTGVTYNGVAMTRATNQVTPTGITRDYLYYLVNPTTGTNNVVVSLSSSTSWSTASVDYYGAKQTGQPDSTVLGGASSGSSGSLGFTTVANNSWTIAIARTEAGGSNPAASTGSVSRVVPADNGFELFDSGAAVTPAGSYTMNWTFGTSTNHNLVGMSIAPSVAAATSYPDLRLAFL